MGAFKYSVGHKVVDNLEDLSHQLRHLFLAALQILHWFTRKAIHNDANNRIAAYRHVEVSGDDVLMHGSVAQSPQLFQPPFGEVRVRAAFQSSDSCCRSPSNVNGQVLPLQFAHDLIEDSYR